VLTFRPAELLRIQPSSTFREGVEVEGAAVRVALKMPPDVPSSERGRRPESVGPHEFDIHIGEGPCLTRFGWSNGKLLCSGMSGSCGWFHAYGLAIDDPIRRQQNTMCQILFVAPRGASAVQRTVGSNNPKAR
jgi:hypothetical protein